MYLVRTMTERTRYVVLRQKATSSDVETARRMLLNAYAAAVGLPAMVTSTVLEITGAPARSFHDWAIDHARDFRTRP